MKKTILALFKFWRYNEKTMGNLQQPRLNSLNFRSDVVHLDKSHDSGNLIYNFYLYDQRQKCLTFSSIKRYFFFTFKPFYLIFK